MILVPHQDLPEDTQSQLAGLQSLVDATSDWQERVRTAASLFEANSGRNTAVGAELRRTLTRMCSGQGRCCYCEDSCGDEIEHFRPKSLYPELVFAWHNFLYACGICNKAKGYRFPVFDAAGQVVPAGRRGAAPISGDTVLIDPRREDPMRLLVLDLRQTFQFRPALGVGARERARAQETLTLLRLDRELLRKARRNAYDGYRARLREYIHAMRVNAAPLHLTRIRRSLLRAPHHTVWREMQRQQALLPELTPLFRAAPEALRF